MRIKVKFVKDGSWAEKHGNITVRDALEMNKQVSGYEKNTSSEAEL